MTNSPNGVIIPLGEFLVFSPEAGSADPNPVRAVRKLAYERSGFMSVEKNSEVSGA